jgi:hypothetical protein
MIRMEAPLNQEAATADLLTDIVAPTPDRFSHLAELARDLTSGTPGWREAWQVEYSADAAETSCPTPEGLTADRAAESV